MPSVSNYSMHEQHVNKPWSTSCFFYSPFSFILSQNIRLRILCSNTLSLSSSLNLKYHVSQPCYPWSHRGCGQKSCKIMWRCYQLLSGFLAKGHLPRMSRQSRRSLMIRMIMKWSWGLCTDLLAFALSWGKPQKTSAETPADEGACDQSSPQMGSLSSKWGR